MGLTWAQHTWAQHTWAGRYEFLLHAEGREGGSGNHCCSGRCRWYFLFNHCCYILRRRTGRIYPTALSRGSKKRHQLHCKWVVRCFPKGATKTVTTTQTCWYSIRLCSSRLQLIDALPDNNHITSIEPKSARLLNP